MKAASVVQDVPERAYRLCGFPADAVNATKVLRSWIFTFAFVSIGAETSIREFGKIGRAPAIAFTVAQTFNVIWTLIISYILFSALE